MDPGMGSVRPRGRLRPFVDLNYSGPDVVSLFVNQYP